MFSKKKRLTEILNQIMIDYKILKNYDRMKFSKNHDSLKFAIK